MFVSTQEGYKSLHGAFMYHLHRADLSLRSAGCERHILDCDEISVISIGWTEQSTLYQNKDRLSGVWGSRNL